MKMDDVLFIGGAAHRLASVRIRCVDIATYLGCDYCLNVKTADEIPQKYRVFVLVKAKLSEPEIDRLSRRGTVIWDIIDHLPPVNAFPMRYIASTDYVRSLLPTTVNVNVVTHYHCNFSRVPIACNLRRPAWIGHPHWYPSLQGLDHDMYSVIGMRREDVETAHRKIGIGLNFRVCSDKSDLHSRMNSGLKLINCIGLGIPSVSAREPSYLEFGTNRTLFGETSNCMDLVRTLIENHRLYTELRNNCLEIADLFHISTVASKYRSLFENL